VFSSRRTEGDLGWIDPYDLVEDDGPHPSEASRGRPELVPAEPVELRSVRRILEPIRRRAVLDRLAHLGASSQQGDRALGRIRHHVGMELGEVHDPLRPHIVERTDADPSCTGQPVRPREQEDRETSERRHDCHADDEPEGKRSSRLRCHPPIVGPMARFVQGPAGSGRAGDGNRTRTTSLEGWSSYPSDLRICATVPPWSRNGPAAASRNTASRLSAMASSRPGNRPP
jgi:hypothetical protein